MGYNFRVLETIESKTENTTLTPITPGRYLVCTNAPDVYYGTKDNVRKHLTDVIGLETDAERIAIFAPLDKSYFVEGTARLWCCLNDAWVDFTSGNGASGAVHAILTADGWVGGKQSISINRLDANQNGVIGITQDISAQATEAVRNGELRVRAQAGGTITIAADGTVSTCGIPTVIILLS